MGCASSSAAGNTGDAEKEGSASATAENVNKEVKKTSNGTPNRTPAKPKPVAVTAVEDMEPIEQSPMPEGKKGVGEVSLGAFPGKGAVDSGGGGVEEANQLASGPTDKLQEALMEEAVKEPQRREQAPAGDPSFTGILDMPEPPKKPSTLPTTKLPSPINSKQAPLSSTTNGSQQMDASAAVSVPYQGSTHRSDLKQQPNATSPVVYPQARTSDKQRSQADAQLQPQPLPAEPPPPDDPWASLQTNDKYQLRESTELKASSSSRRSGKGSFAASRNNSLRGREQEVLEYDEEDGELHARQQKSGHSAPGNNRHSRARGAKAGLPPVGPKTGGWGHGSLAAAGTIMLGKEEDALLKGEPVSNPSSIRRSDDVKLGMGDHDDDDGSGDDSDLPSPVPKKKAPTIENDLGMEDIDDVDALLEEEEKNGGLNKDLAAKLRAFEALADDD